MKIKIIENKDGTFSVYNKTEKRFVIKDTTKFEADRIKKIIDDNRKAANKLNKGIR